MPETLEKTLRISNKKGLHARAAAKFVKLASGYDDVVIEVVKDGSTVGGTSIMGLLMLAAGMNSTITIKTSGRDAEPALEALSGLVARGFDEE